MTHTARAKQHSNYCKEIRLCRFEQVFLALAVAGFCFSYFACLLFLCVCSQWTTLSAVVLTFSRSQTCSIQLWVLAFFYLVACLCMCCSNALFTQFNRAFQCMYESTDSVYPNMLSVDHEPDSMCLVSLFFFFFFFKFSDKQQFFAISNRSLCSAWKLCVLYSQIRTLALRKRCVWIRKNALAHVYHHRFSHFLILMHLNAFRLHV